MSMSLNKVMLIGRVTADPELRYTSQGTAISTFSVATNRNWNDKSGQRQEETEFTRCVAWAKLAEICSQILHKGRQVYVDGRMQTREWEGQDGNKRRTTEVVLSNMIALGPGDSSATGASTNRSVPDPDLAEFEEEIIPEKETGKSSADKTNKTTTKKSSANQSTSSEAVSPEDIPF